MLHGEKHTIQPLTCLPEQWPPVLMPCLISFCHVVQQIHLRYEIITLNNLNRTFWFFYLSIASNAPYLLMYELWFNISLVWITSLYFCYFSYTNEWTRQTNIKKHLQCLKFGLWFPITCSLQSTFMKQRVNDDSISINCNYNNNITSGIKLRMCVKVFPRLYCLRLKLILSAHKNLTSQVTSLLLCQ